MDKLFLIYKKTLNFRDFFIFINSRLINRYSITSKLHRVQIKPHSITNKPHRVTNKHYSITSKQH